MEKMSSIRPSSESVVESTTSTPQSGVLSSLTSFGRLRQSQFPKPNAQSLNRETTQTLSVWLPVSQDHRVGRVLRRENTAQPFGVTPPLGLESQCDQSRQGRHPEAFPGGSGSTRCGSECLFSRRIRSVSY